MKIKNGRIQYDNDTERRLSNTYYGMVNRCTNPKSDRYNIYGGKGIRVCDEWSNDKSKFIKWGIENGYEIGLSIDRIDPNKNYEPSNCQFITKNENSRKVFIDNKKIKCKNCNREFLPSIKRPKTCSKCSLEFHPDKRFGKKTQDNLKFVSFYITDEQHQKLIKKSKESGVPMAEIVRRAINKAMEGKQWTKEQ